MRVFYFTIFVVLITMHISPLAFGSEIHDTTASWYGRDFHGKRTASGKIFNMYSNTVAHKTLPLGTKIKITNTRNHKSTIACVADRGPYVKGRDLDLSYAVARKLGTIKQGLARVQYQVIR